MILFSEYQQYQEAVIDAEVARMLREAEERAVATLKEHRDILDKLTDLLVTNETVDGSQIYELAGRPEPSLVGAGVTMAPDRAAATGRQITPTKLTHPVDGTEPA